MSDETTTVIEPETGEPTNAKPTCAKCGTFQEWGEATWCPVCGYYPKFDAEPDAVDTSLQAQSSHEPVSVMQMLKTLPQWANILIAGALLIVVGSICVRVAYSYSAANRGFWAICQLLLGVIMAVAAHCRAAFIGLNKDQKLDPMDIVMAPFATWNRTFRDLPWSRLTVWLGGWGITVALSAIVIVGGIRYSAIFDDWGFVAPESNEVVGVRQGNGKNGARKQMKSLINKEFVMLPPAPEGPFVKCIAYGYLPGNSPGQFCDTVLFAGSLNGEFIHVAKVDYAQMPKDKRGRLAVMMKERAEDNPFFAAPYSAIYVEPSIVCKVNYNNMESNGRLTDPVFESVEMDLRKERAFAKLKEKGDFSQLIGRLNVEKYHREYETRMEEYDVKCEKIIALHKENTNPAETGKNSKETFEDVSKALSDNE